LVSDFVPSFVVVDPPFVPVEPLFELVLVLVVVLPVEEFESEFEPPAGLRAAFWAFFDAIWREVVVKRVKTGPPLCNGD
jgi:hypothetical protein